MTLSEQEQISYLANVAYLARADGVLSPREQAAIEEVRADLEAKKGTLNAAVKAVDSGTYSPAKVGFFAVQVANLADMLYVCFVDGDFDESESIIVKKFCEQISITGDQLKLMMSDAIARADKTSLTVKCPACSNSASGSAKFCPSCGGPIGKPEEAAAKLAFEIPASGYAIEFAESSAGGFPAALEFAKSAPTLKTCVRNKKTWYLAGWPERSFAEVIRLARFLGGIRNRKCYQNGSEVPWEDLFGFVWCAQQRDTAYRPNEYCFGKDENRLNPWGCKQARMDWTEWAAWFSYGQFKRAGIFKGKDIWVFDKARIRHEVLTNLHRFRFCPYLRPGLVDAILSALPDEVEVIPQGPWKYSARYDEVPGSIKVVELRRVGNVEIKDEYFADGVRPFGVGILEEVFKRAFAEAGLKDVASSQFTT
ncbi:MAG: zinc ribbon domain-containing protein [Acidobacteria bacterium]|nr:zinc ribbon domain-containing protein [Acidobacteriota bacterium]